MLRKSLPAPFELPPDWIEVTPGLRWRKQLGARTYAAIVRDLDQPAHQPGYFVMVYLITGVAVDAVAYNLPDAIRRAEEVPEVQDAKRSAAREVPIHLAVSETSAA